jgi:hypothetical protein
LVRSKALNLLCSLQQWVGQITKKKESAFCLFLSCLFKLLIFPSLSRNMFPPCLYTAQAALGRKPCGTNSKFTPPRGAIARGPTRSRPRAERTSAFSCARGNQRKGSESVRWFGEAGWGGAARAANATRPRLVSPVARCRRRQTTRARPPGYIYATAPAADFFRIHHRSSQQLRSHTRVKHYHRS